MLKAVQTGYCFVAGAHYCMLTLQLGEFFLTEKALKKERMRTERQWGAACQWTHTARSQLASLTPRLRVEPNPFALD